MKRLKKLTWRKILIFILSLLIIGVFIYAYLCIVGLSIKKPRKEMAKPLTYYGVNLYEDEHKRELASMVASFEMGLGHAWTNYAHSDGEQETGVNNGPGPKVLVEIHKNGWMKIFYATYEEDIPYVNYDYIGRKFLLTPWQYKKLVDMAAEVENSSPTAEDVISKDRDRFSEETYPSYYSYGVSFMPKNWEEEFTSARLFYDGHWYVSSPTLDGWRKYFEEDNRYITKQIAKEKEENCFRWD